ncbi:MAG: hypothetical protein AAF990_25145 [Bacteroidota bacterium]
MDHKEYIEGLIAKGKTEEAIKELQRGAQDSELKNGLILLSGRLHVVKDNERMGLQSSDQITMAHNRIRHTLMSYLADYQPPEDIVFGQDA